MNLFHRTRVLKIDPDNPQGEAIKLAAEIIKEGGLVVFPTETVYGLGADYLNQKAVERIYSVKDRPKDKPLTLHISDIDMLEKFITVIPNITQMLINHFWPGPLTIILKSKDGKKLGFRMPRNKVALRLIEQCGTPLVAPSANPSGEKPPTDAKDVTKSLWNKIDMILDGGATQIGKESTIVDATVFPYTMIREGAISKSRLSEAWHAI